MTRDIRMENVSKAFGEKKILEHYSAVIKGGECCGLMGQSGCGKTTLLRLLMGFEKADEGEILGLPERIAAVFQEDRLCMGFSAADNVRAVLSKRASREELMDNLGAVGLAEVFDMPVRKLSGGMKRRAAIVRACMAESDLLLLDEPFRGLDHETRKCAAEYILKKTEGKTLVIATHEEQELELLRSSQVLRLKM